MLPFLVALQVTAPPPPVAPYPYPYPYYPAPYMYQPPAPPPAPDPAVSWFVRLHLGAGPMAFSPETSVLRLEGYGGTKLWGMADGGYLFHPNVGAGAFVAFGYLSSTPSNSPSFTETDVIAGAGLPIKLGTRSISCVITPRIGGAAGRLAIHDDPAFRPAFAWGGDVALTSFRYHLSALLGYLRAAGPSGGAAGLTHDFGGLYVLAGGTIDG